MYHDPIFSDDQGTITVRPGVTWQDLIEEEQRLRDAMRLASSENRPAGYTAAKIRVQAIQKEANRRLHEDTDRATVGLYLREHSVSGDTRAFADAFVAMRDRASWDPERTVFRFAVVWDRAETDPGMAGIDVTDPTALQQIVVVDAVCAARLAGVPRDAIRAQVEGVLSIL